MSETAYSVTRTQEERAPRWLSSVEMRAWMAFWGAMYLVDAAVDRDLQKRDGLSHGEYQILAMLSAVPERRLRMSALAEIVFISRSRLTYQVTQLEKAGLVRRQEAPGDKRGAMCRLTEQGTAKLRAAAPEHVACVRRVFVDVMTPEQIAVLGDALGAVTDHLLQDAEFSSARELLATLAPGRENEAQQSAAPPGQRGE